MIEEEKEIFIEKYKNVLKFIKVAIDYVGSNEFQTLSNSLQSIQKIKDIESFYNPLEKQIVKKIFEDNSGLNPKIIVDILKFLLFEIEDRYLFNGFDFFDLKKRINDYDSSLYLQILFKSRLFLVIVVLSLMDDLQYPKREIKEFLYRVLTTARNDELIHPSYNLITFSAQKYSIFFIFLIKLYRIFKIEGNLNDNILKFLLDTKEIFFSNLFLEITYKIVKRWRKVDVFFIIIEYSKHRIGLEKNYSDTLKDLEYLLNTFKGDLDPSSFYYELLDGIIRKLRVPIIEEEIAIIKKILSDIHIHTEKIDPMNEKIESSHEEMVKYSHTLLNEVRRNTKKLDLILCSDAEFNELINTLRKLVNDILKIDLKKDKFSHKDLNLLKNARQIFEMFQLSQGAIEYHNALKADRRRITFIIIKYLEDNPRLYNFFITIEHTIPLLKEVYNLIEGLFKILG